MLRQPNDIGLTFLIITRGFWGKGTDIRKLKQEAVRKGNWAKGAKRVYYLHLVHEDAEVLEDGTIQYPHKLAERTALFLGEI